MPKELADIPCEKISLIKGLNEAFSSSATASSIEKVLDLLQFIGSAISLNYLLQLVDLISYQPIIENPVGPNAASLTIPLLMAISNVVELTINAKAKTSTVFEKLEPILLLPTLSMSIISGLEGSGMLQQKFAEIPELLLGLQSNLDKMPELFIFVSTVAMAIYLINNLSQTVVTMGIFAEVFGSWLQSAAEWIDSLKKKIEQKKDKNPVKNALLGVAFVSSALLANQNLDYVLFNSQIINNLLQNDVIKDLLYGSIPLSIIISQPQLLISLTEGAIKFLAFLIKSVGALEVGVGKLIQDNTK